MTKSEEKTNTSDASIEFLGEEQIPNDELSPELKVSSWLYNQISDQITNMVGAVLVKPSRKNGFSIE